MEAHDTPGLDAIDMCLVSGLMIPPKFKVPNFDKYIGLSWPKRHLVMFCQKISSYTHDAKLIIHYFLDNLSEASLSWYMDLERSCIQSWKDLANAFLKKYQYNFDVAPSHIQLQDLSQKSSESFKEYA